MYPRFREIEEGRIDIDQGEARNSERNRDKIG
jgi:hypothetical protein